MRRYRILPLLLVVLLCGCMVAGNKQQTGLAKKYTFDAMEVSLDIGLDENQTLSLWDAWGDHLLFTISDKTVYEDKATAIHYTCAVMIFNAATGKVETVWIPEDIMLIQSAVLTSDNSVICNALLEIEDPTGVADTIISFNENQMILKQMDAYLDRPRRLEDGTILIPYKANTEDGVACGVVCYRDGAETDDYAFLNEEMAISSLEVLDSQLCYVCEENGKSYFVTADAQGEICRNEFAPQSEKLTDFCLTANGVLACVESESGYQYVLMKPDGERVTMDAPGTNSALYRLNANRVAVLAVNYEFRQYALTYSEGELNLTENPCGSEITSHYLGAISTFVADENTFYVYCGDNLKLFRIDTIVSGE